VGSSSGGSSAAEGGGDSATKAVPGVSLVCGVAPSRMRSTAVRGRQ